MDESVIRLIKGDQSSGSESSDKSPDKFRDSIRTDAVTINLEKGRERLENVCQNRQNISKSCDCRDIFKNHVDRLRVESKNYIEGSY